MNLTSLNALDSQIQAIVRNLVSIKSMKVYKRQITTLVALGGVELEKSLLIALLENIVKTDQLANNNSKVRKQFLKERLDIFMSNRFFLEHFAEAIHNSERFHSMKPSAFVELMKNIELPSKTLLVICLSLTLAPGISAEVQSDWIKEMKEILHPCKLFKSFLDALLNIVQSFSDFSEPKYFSIIGQIIQNNLEAFSEPEIDYLAVEYNLTILPSETKPEPTAMYKSKSSKQRQDDDKIKKMVPFSPNNLTLCDIFKEIGPLSEPSSFKEVLSTICKSSSGDEFSSSIKHEILSFFLMVSQGGGLAECDLVKRAIVIRSYISPMKLKPDFSEDTFSINKETLSKIGGAAWNFDFLAKTFVEYFQGMKWSEVWETIDRPGLEFENDSHFRSFFSIISKVRTLRKGNDSSLPKKVLFEQWKHPASQVHFLLRVSACENPDIFFFSELKGSSVFIEQLLANKLDNASIVSLTGMREMSHIWGCVSIVELLINLSEGEGCLPIVRLIFERPRTICPDLLMLTLAATHPTQGSLVLNELYSSLFPIYLKNHANSSELLEALWAINHKLFIKALSELCKSTDKGSLINFSRVLDISQQIKESLLPMANSSDYDFSVALGVLAGKRDFLNLENWISDRIRKVGSPFVVALLKYIEENLLVPSRKAKDQSKLESILEKSQLVKQSLAVIFDLFLKKFDDQISMKIKKQVLQHYKEICEIWPDFSNSTSTQIEDAANSYFNSIYEEQISLEEFIDILKKYKSSSNSTEQEIFACMIHNLFDEYRFFIRYPVRELHITGAIFGSIINHKMIDGVTLRVALKCVQDSLKKDGKLFEFGIKSLEYFKYRVHEWTELCQNLFANAKLREKYPEILDDIKGNLRAHNSLNLIPAEHIAEVEESLRRRNATGGSAHNDHQISGLTEVLASPVFQNQEEGIFSSAMSTAANISPKIENVEEAFLMGTGINQIGIGALGQMNPIQPNQMSGAAYLELETEYDRLMRSPEENNGDSMINMVPVTLSGIEGSIGTGVGVDNNSSDFPPLEAVHSEGFGIKSSEGSGPSQESGRKRAPDSKGYRSHGFQEVGYSSPRMRSTSPIMSSQSNASMQMQVGAGFKGSSGIGGNSSMATSRPAPIETVSLEKEKGKMFELVTSEIQEKLDETQQMRAKQITNSLTRENVDSKANDCKALFESNLALAKWYVRNLLYERVTQRNMQRVYFRLIEGTGKKAIVKDLKGESFRLFKHLLQFVMDLAPGVEVEDADLLLSYGEWIGVITLMRNQGIILRDLDIKEVLKEAHHKKTLNHVVPPILSILSTVIPDKIEKEKLFNVFKPNNPFMIAILSVLAEIFFAKNIEISSKCLILIENLFHDMNISMNKFPKSSILPGKVEKNRQENLMEFIKIDESVLRILSQIPNIKDIVVSSVDKVIMEFFPAVMSRTVNVTVQAAKVVTLKDFAFEPNPEKVIEALKVMISSLSGKLALVLSREYLRMHMKNELETKLTEFISVSSDEGALDKEITAIVASNLDIACKMVKSSVIDRGFEELMKDPDIEIALRDRRNALNNGVPYADPHYADSFKKMPAPLRPGTKQDSEDLENIYMNFSEKKQAPPQPTPVPVPMLILSDQSQFPQATSIDSGLSSVSNGLVGGPSSQANLPIGISGPNAPLMATIEDPILIFQSNHMGLMQIIEENALSGLDNTILKQQLEENLKKIEQYQKELIPELGETILLNMLEKKDEKLFKDFMDVLWEHCFCCPELPIKITNIILEYKDEKVKYDSYLQIHFMKRNLIHIPTFDKFYSTLLSSLYQSGAAVEKCENEAAALKCLFKVLKVNVYKDKWIPIQKFPQILKCFSTLQQKQTLAGWDKEIQKNIECILNTADGDDQYYGLYTFSSKVKQRVSLHEDAIAYFGDMDMAFYEFCFRWLEKLLSSSEKEEMDSFLESFEREIYNSYQRPGHTRRFFTYVAEICVASACNSHVVDLGGGKTFSHCNSLDYTFVDGFTKFIMVLVKTLRENKKEMLNQILYSVLVVFHKDHELLKNGFNPRPYFRLFYNILYDIHREEYNFEESDKMALLSVLVKSLEGIQPLLFPKFACAWLNLISLPQFVRNLTTLNPSQYLKLLYPLLRFLRKLIDRDGFKTKFALLYYTGVIRLFTVLILDCSEFCASEFFGLLQECPKQLHQLRSFILSATPEDSSKEPNIGEDRLVHDNFQVNNQFAP